MSITFDPFNVLSVPIPRQATLSTMQVRYYPLNFLKPVIQVTLALTNGERTTISDIKEKVRQSILDQALAEGDSCTLDDIQPPIICIARDNRIEMLARSDFCIGNLESGFKLVALERQ